MAGFDEMGFLRTRRGCFPGMGRADAAEAVFYKNGVFWNPQSTYF